MENYFDSAPCCYFSFGDNSELVVVNQTIAEVLGYTKEELTGRKVDIIFPVSTRIFYQTHFYPMLKMHGHAEEIFIFLLAKNGQQIPVLMNAKRVQTEGVVHNNCVCIIVPNRKKFEDELVLAKKNAETALQENTMLKNAQEELSAQAAKLDRQIQIVNRQNNELKQFNRVATHDLEEPLRKIMFLVNKLTSQPEQADTQKQELQKLSGTANLMRGTITGLQQYVWLSESTIHPAEVDISTLLMEVKNELDEELNEDLLEMQMQAAPVINADSQQVRLLFYHILKNAIQYRSPGQKATVSITTQVIKKNIFKALDGKYQYEDFLQVTVKDKGIGFEKRYKKQVFELFKKLHHHDRRGLGLSFCKQIVENHGGWIEAESKPFEGTAIHLFFPAGILQKLVL